MKRLFTWTILASAILLMGAPQSARAQLGVAAGLNFADLNDIDSGSRSATFENATGYHVGIFYDVGAGPAGLRLGLFYRDAGEFDADYDGIRNSFALSMIDVPVDVRLNLTATPIIRPYVFGGPVFSFPRADENDIDDNLKKVSVAGDIGVGIALNLGGITLFPEFRYAIGISRIMKDTFEVGNVSFESDDAQRINSAMLRLGVRF